MAETNYFLKSVDGLKIYRIPYIVNEGQVSVGGAFITGHDVTVPSGMTLDGIDVGAQLADVLVDVILATVVEGTVAEYRALAKTIADADIDARW